ncbi:MAG: hypothetical protein JWN40_369 [Phycisphaerales bacterium]|nr:hypothetical protein [Phycisphaerales bacterium]
MRGRTNVGVAPAIALQRTARRLHVRLVADGIPPAEAGSRGRTWVTGGDHAGGIAEAAVKVRLIDGEELAELMIDYDVGVAAADTYVVKKVDTDFFETMV